MAKRTKKSDSTSNEPEGHGVSALRGNGFDKEAVEGFVSRIENLNGDLATEKSEFMTRCKTIRGDIKDVFDEAKGAGIPKKELKRVIKRRALENKIENLREELEGDEQHNYDMLLHALGHLADTPLGGAALQAAA